jgi:hypothetical protein
MNYTKLFYWLTVADNAKHFFTVFIVIFTIISLVATIAYLTTWDDNDKQRLSRKWMWWSYPFLILFWTLNIFTPSKKDSLLIIAGGQTLNYLTTDSVATQIPRELTAFVVSELKNMAQEAKVELGVMSEKEKLLESLKGLTVDEVLLKLKENPNLLKIYMDTN